MDPKKKPRMLAIEDVPAKKIARRGSGEKDIPDEPPPLLPPDSPPPARSSKARPKDDAPPRDSAAKPRGVHRTIQKRKPRPVEPDGEPEPEGDIKRKRRAAKTTAPSRRAPIRIVEVA
jgi:hypothetical protein